MSEKDVRQMKINLPVEIKKWVERQAEKNMRSQSAEIAFALKEKMSRQAKEDDDT
jgi:predicted transcriptional regulator